MFEDFTSFSKSYNLFIISVIASLDFFECSASSRTDSATTLKPLPNIPARAASIEALSDKSAVSFGTALLLCKGVN